MLVGALLNSIHLQSRSDGQRSDRSRQVDAKHIPDNGRQKTATHQSPQAANCHPQQQQTSKGGQRWTTEGESGSNIVDQPDISEGDCEHPIRPSATNQEQHADAEHFGRRNRGEDHAT